MPVQQLTDQENKFFSQLNEAKQEHKISQVNDVKQEDHTPFQGDEKKANNADNERIKNLKMKTVIDMQNLAQRVQLGLCVLSLLEFYRTGDYQELLLVSAPLTCLFERALLSFNNLVLLARGADVREAMAAHTPSRYSFLTNIGNKLVINPVKAVVTTYFCGRR